MVRITLLDEVKFKIEGLTDSEYNAIYESMKLPKAGAFMTMGYQLKLDDGMESLMTEDGYGYQFFLNDVLDMLEEMGHVDDVDFLDNRREIHLPIELIDENYLQDEIGMSLRDHQVSAANDAITSRCGILSAATSSGKTVICIAISKYFQEHLKSLVIVPNVKLGKQTAAEYVNAGLNAVFIDPDRFKTNPKRMIAIQEHRHIIVTSKLILNLIAYDLGQKVRVLANNSFVLLYDEAHIFGDRMFELFFEELAQCPIRIGMTGTVPKDQLKFAKICGSLNGEQIDVVKAHELIAKKQASNLHVDLIVVDDPEVQELCTPELVRKGDWDWDKEARFYNNRKLASRVVTIIEELEPKNTLLLCRPELGQRIGELLTLPMIYKDTPNDERDRIFNQFDTSDDGVLVLASFDTSGTGVSKNNIQRVILVDSGKNETWVLQGIGRGIRLDNKENFCEVVDISSNTYYAKKHRNERKKIYKREKYPFSKEIYVEV